MIIKNPLTNFSLILFCLGVIARFRQQQSTGFYDDLSVFLGDKHSLLTEKKAGDIGAGSILGGSFGGPVRINSSSSILMV